MMWKEWRAPAGLIALSLIPVIFGVIRSAEMLSDPAVTPDNARYVANPLPILVHAIGAVVYCVLGALQFVPSLRKHRRPWHRVAGRLLVPCGLAVAASGLWMTLFEQLPVLDGMLLGAFRVFFGALMMLSLILGVIAIRRRNLRQHQAWMMRAYAIALGAGTQAFTHFAWLIPFGEPDVFTHALLMAAGWLINLAYVEYLLRRPARSTPDRRPSLNTAI